MNLSFTQLLLVSFLAPAFLLGGQNGASAALVDCSQTQVSRENSPELAICNHFAGVDSQAYLDWYNSNEIPSKYPNTVFLAGSDPDKPEDGVAVHWEVIDEHVYIAVVARATGWIGFGIGEAGGMIGADMVLFTASRPNELVDAYTTDLRIPQVDDCASDWELVTSHVDDQDGFLMFEAKRLLDTGDPQDKPIVDDASNLIPPHRVIAAWGDSPEVGYHGLKRARGAIRFFGTGDAQETFEKAMDRHAEGSFEVRSVNHIIASNDTEYAYTCVSRQDMIDQGVLDTQGLLNIVGFEPIIEEGREAYVHHFVVAGGQSCDDDFFVETAYVWAPGEGALALPDHLGAPLFGDNGFQAFEIEVHYNNPQLDEGVIDNSGVRFHWTSQQRENQIGILSIGDPWVNLYGFPVGEGMTLHEFDCPSSCSSKIDEPVTVLREYLHMHQTGLRMTNQQIRDGEVLRSGIVDYWEFDQNGNAAVLQDGFEIQPGDGFKTSCYFDGKDDTVFGLSSQEEMCMAFLYYYPRKTLVVSSTTFGFEEMFPIEMPWMCGVGVPIDGCDAEYAVNTLDSVDELGREFGVKVASEECKQIDDTKGSIDDGIGSGSLDSRDSADTGENSGVVGCGMGSLLIGMMSMMVPSTMLLLL